MNMCSKLLATTLSEVRIPSGRTASDLVLYLLRLLGGPRLPVQPKLKQCSHSPKHTFACSDRMKGCVYLDNLTFPFVPIFWFQGNCKRLFCHCSIVKLISCYKYIFQQSELDLMCIACYLIFFVLWCMHFVLLMLVISITCVAFGYEYRLPMLLFHDTHHIS
jgi:hypothetical protein